MTQAAHTPGPWAVRRSSKGYPYQIHAPNGGHVKDITRWAAISVPSLKEGEANARLIAAAPDLFAALSRLVDYHEEGRLPSREAMDEALAALDKAEGRTP